jgi:aryl-alcohol dehydrogenase-like predicted oxidoreductase
MADFLRRELRAVGKPVHRLGLAMSFGIDEAGVRAGVDRGINYFFWPEAQRATGRLIKDIIAKERDRFVIATGPTLGYFAGSVRRSAERALKKLGTDYLDVFQLFWVGRTSALTDSTMKELVALKESGKAKAIGISIHDRPRAGKLAADSPLDLFMIRYNAAHPGADRDIFPHLETRKPSVVAYTATAWRRLLAAPSGWTGAPMTAGDCYRFCLSSPHVDVTLCGPKNRAELDENLAALEKGPLTSQEEAQIREYGKVVHGKAVVRMGFGA